MTEIGHTQERALLATQLERGSVPQVLALVGPPGAGKEHLARWVAQALLCTPTAPTAAEPSFDLFGTPEPSVPAAVQPPCQTCTSCRQFAKLAHPDFTWHTPHENPGTGDAGKRAYLTHQAELLASVRAGGPPRPRASGLGYTQTAGAVIVEEARQKPVSGTRRVVLLSDLHRLSAQAGADATANALLKTLEEPAPGTTIIATVSDLGAVLPTIRSRLSAMPVAPYSQEDGVAILGTYFPAASAEARAQAWRLSRGHITRAAQAVEGELPGRSAAKEMLRAAWSRDIPLQRKLAASHGAKGARGEYLTMLLEAEDLLVDTHDLMGGRDEGVADSAWGLEVRSMLRTGLLSSALVAETSRAVLQAEQASMGNAMPALVSHTLFRRIERAQQSAHGTWASARLATVASAGRAPVTPSPTGARPAL